jgi:hypothetical protein
MIWERSEETKNEDGCVTCDIKYFHDGRLVRPFEIQAKASAPGNPGELGGGVFRVCLSGTGKSNWNTHIFGNTTKDYARVYNVDCVYGFCLSGFS